MKRTPLVLAGVGAAVLALLAALMLLWTDAPPDAPGAPSAARGTGATAATDPTPPKTAGVDRPAPAFDAAASPVAAAARGLPAAPVPTPGTSPGAPPPPPPHSGPTPPAPTAPSAGTGPAPDAGVRYRLDRDGIRGAVRASIGEVKDCYEQWLKLQPALGGRLAVKFTIDTDDGVEGRVTAISVGDAGIGHTAMEGCVLNVFQDLRFEAPLSGPLDVTYPLVFSSAPDGG